jgi:hypothetical protein
MALKWLVRADMAVLAVKATQAAGENGLYSCALFIGLPAVLGFISAFRWKGEPPKPYGILFGEGLLTLIAYGACLIVLGVEGIACMIMASPLAIVALMLGVFVASEMTHKEALRDKLMGVLVLAVTGAGAGYADSGPPLVSTHGTSIDISASPHQVWNAVVALKDLPEPTDPLLKYAFACPRSTEIVNQRVGGARLCTLSTGSMPETITVWERDRRLGFVALSTPPTMPEINPFWQVDAPHLHGYYRVLYGEFKLEELPDGGTRLWRYTRYEQRIRPVAYWRFWCNLGAERAQRFVLEYVKREAEAGNRFASAR